MNRLGVGHFLGISGYRTGPSRAFLKGDAVGQTPRRGSCNSAYSIPGEDSVRIVLGVDNHLRPDTLRCGVDKPEKDPGGFQKKLRELAGRAADMKASVTWREGKNRVIKIGKKFFAAEFLLEMIEGAEEVRLYSQSGTPMPH
jgi:hypothetical protein